jgi:chromosomal replication initiation ATPase DnaA
MYLSHVVCRLSLSEIGAVFARDRSTVAHACGLVEDQRDDPILDAKLDCLERAVLALLAALSLPRSCR